jgi:polyisoprenyl-teichoic acid--peptidoglycan teichoic acid transferase
VIPDFPRRARRGTIVRFFLAGLLVVGLTAGATATAGLLQVKNFVNDLNRGQTIKHLQNVLTPADYGKAQTLLLIGSDHRFTDVRGDARSDTMLLVRLDPNASAITMLSIPRDLQVSYSLPGNRGVRTAVKMNQTYTDGGEALTARVIKQLLPRVKINHIININFGGFSEAINAIGCVYADVDHRYHHVNQPGGDQYSEINIPAGYQRLCGTQALQYVRYRHTDTDFVRAARQQDFLRQIRSQYGASDFASNPHKITRIIGKYSTTDPNLHSTDALLKLVNLGIYTAGKPIRQIQFPPAYLNVPGGGSYVTATPAVLQQMQNAFLQPPPKPAAAPKAKASPKRGRGRKASGSSATALGLADMTQVGRDYAIRLGGGVGLPIYYPKLLSAGSQYMTPLQGQYPRAYRIRAPDGKMRGAYRLVVRTTSQGNEVYYGVQGTSWTDAPILKAPSSDHRTVNGKKLDLFYDGVRLRTVAWRSGRAVYWVENTLQDALTNDQMLAIAGSMTRLGKG